MYLYRQTEPRGEVFPYVFTLLDFEDEDYIGQDQYKESVRAWCKEQFGDSGRRFGTTRYRVTSTRAKFMTADDAFAFKMRWC